MKKNVLALSITAGMLGLGFAGGAQAMSVAPLSGSTALSFLSMNKDGVGHMFWCRTSLLKQITAR
jgi:hypothetical protein